MRWETERDSNARGRWSSPVPNQFRGHVPRGVGLAQPFGSCKTRKYFQGALFSVSMQPIHTHTHTHTLAYSVSPPLGLAANVPEPELEQPP